MSIANAYACFQVDLTSLFFLDQRTQSQSPSLALVQLATINEAILIRAFRAYENLLESVFLEYVQGVTTLSNIPVESYLRPQNTEHAYSLVKSSQTFLEWNSPVQVIARAEIYLRDGNPIKPVIAAKQSVLTDLRKIRNHIAHNSRTSTQEFKKVVQNYLQTLPLTIPTPGEFLQFVKPRTQSSILRFFLDEIADTAYSLVN